MNKRRWLALAALLLTGLIALALSGCGTETRTDSEAKREKTSESRSVTKEVTVHTPTADGGFIVEKTTTTDTTAGERVTSTSAETARTAPDAATRTLIASGGKIAGAVVNAATGGGLTGAGGLVEIGVTSAITAILAGYGAAKNAQAKQLREERDFHKDDAEKGWSKFERASGGEGKA